jgi:integrase/recombinase XerD
MPKFKEYVFTGPLEQPIRQFVAEKRALGCAYNATSKTLVRFAKFASEQNCEENVLSKDIVEAYCAAREDESPNTQQTRISLMRNLAEFMLRNGYSAYVIQLRLHSGCWYDNYVPYIFTHEEIAEMMKQSDTFQSHICSPNRKYMVPLVFRMLYSCGLRSSEVLNLDVKDVDVENGVLTIRNAKYDKDRFVPMSESLTNRCRMYLKQVHHESSPDAPFFPNVNGNHFAERALYDPFRILLAKSGISHGGKGSGPRVHDLRHTFAVHCLKRWVLDGEDITSKLPLLSAYLGHKKISSTGRYLRLTLDLFPKIAQTLEIAYPDLIPTLEVSNCEGN